MPDPTENPEPLTICLSSPLRPRQGLPTANSNPLTPLQLDKQGWKELNKALAETVDKAAAIQKDAAKRMGKDKDKAIQTKLAIMHFEVPSAKGRGKKKKKKKK